MIEQFLDLPIVRIDDRHDLQQLLERDTDVWRRDVPWKHRPLGEALHAARSPTAAAHVGDVNIGRELAGGIAASIAGNERLHLGSLDCPFAWAGRQSVETRPSKGKTLGRDARPIGSWSTSLAPLLSSQDCG